MSIVTAGPTITTATVRLGAHLAQDADGAPGDITFKGKCVVQKIDPSTSLVVQSFGNFTLTVDARVMAIC